VKYIIGHEESGRSLKIKLKEKMCSLKNLLLMKFWLF